MKMHKRYYVYLGIMGALIFSSFFWGNPGQRWNTRQVGEVIIKVKEKLKDDARFSGIKFLYSTANMGKNIYVDGTVADQASLDYLKKLIEQEAPAKFTTVWRVEVETDAIGPIKEGDDPPGADWEAWFGCNGRVRIYGVSHKKIPRPGWWTRDFVCYVF